jgi:hypothetical protein
MERYCNNKPCNLSPAKQSFERVKIIPFQEEGRWLESDPDPIYFQNARIRKLLSLPDPSLFVRTVYKVSELAPDPTLDPSINRKSGIQKVRLKKLFELNFHERFPDFTHTKRMLSC